MPMPALAADEVLIAVMASGINYNTVWSATFDPVPTFAFVKYFGRQGGDAARHDQRFHVLGSDAAGVVTLGRVKSALSAVYPFAEAAEAARLVQENLHLGKVGVLALAPEVGLGVTDPVMREKLGADIAPLMA
ncbi:hypothetical protein ACFWIW_26295 [Amycolatopsis sp. NPDC058340]|uniref:hypothetical protein n=1 Tax=Amycolatopsis sp. NPDC058340 TaxID=3346453 RepID=UPI00364E2A39